MTITRNLGTTVHSYVFNHAECQSFLCGSGSAGAGRARFLRRTRRAKAHPHAAPASRLDAQVQKFNNDKA